MGCKGVNFTRTCYPDEKQRSSVIKGLTVHYSQCVVNRQKKVIKKNLAPSNLYQIFFEMNETLVGRSFFLIGLFYLQDVCRHFSSPEPLGSQGELIVYPSSRRPSVRRSQC